jgi:hypothetical protein
MIIPLGRKNLRELYNFQTRMESSPRSSPSLCWNWEPSQLAVLVWWSETLSVPNIGMKLCRHTTPSNSFSLFSDASSSFGVGIIINHEFDLFELSSGWKDSGKGSRDIGWAEFVGVELTVFFVLRTYDLHDTHLLINTDNQGVIGAWSKRSSRSIEQNEVLGRVICMLLSRSCFLSLRYVTSAENPADAPSRGVAPIGYLRRTFPGFPKSLVGLLHRPDSLASRPTLPQ